MNKDKDSQSSSSSSPNASAQPSTFGSNSNPASNVASSSVASSSVAAPMGLNSEYGQQASSSSLNSSQPVAPSNASIQSSRPGTISTYQSSVFSRNAASISTGASSRYSAANHFPEPIAEDDESTSGKPMKILDPAAMSSMTDAGEAATVTPAGLRSQNSTSGSVRINTTIGARTSNLMPEVPMPGSSPSRDLFATNQSTRSSSVSSGSSLPRYMRSHAGVQASSNNLSTSPAHTVHASSSSPSRPASINISSTASASVSASSVGHNASSILSPPPSSPVTAVAVAPLDLSSLADDLCNITEQVSNGVLEIARAASSITSHLRSASANPALDNVADDQFSLHTHPAITRIIKAVLHFSDTLLRHSQMQPTKMYVLRALYQFGVRLKLVSPTYGTVPYPRNFAIGSIPELSSQNMLTTLLDTVASHDDGGIAEQEGAYIAPVLRGLSPEFSVLTLSFGFPKIDNSHFDMVSSLYDVSPDIHIYCHKNYIRACGGFKAPYRTPEDPNSPPMSVSLATVTASSLSGTLGGYIYPKVDPSEPELADYGRSTFAMTCAHVCLSEINGTNYPDVSIPSPVLVNLYRKALNTERSKYSFGSPEYQEYDRVINEVEKQYKQNRPEQSFGQVVWGERTVVEGRISDLAIIKCNSKMQCRNYLGDDVEFSEYDPALMFGNLYVKRIVRKLMPGMNVFKYGSTSKYTRGKVNGPRLVYWADGKIQSSEFVVNSDSPIFASGGDSGAWILQKSEDDLTGDDNRSTHSAGSTRGPCLGVVGMLHSYDGERKELGLFTPIHAILDRLHEVTHIQWGVVGVQEDVDEVPAGGSDSDVSENDESSEGEPN